MIYTKQNVIDYVNEEDVKFIRLVFCSSKTVQKNISIMPNQLENAFEKGIAISSSHIEGFEKYGQIGDVGVVESPVCAHLPFSL